jgi:hypothetical protein
MKQTFPSHFANYAGPGRTFTDAGTFASDALAIASAKGRKMAKGLRLVAIHTAAGVVIFRA